MNEEQYSRANKRVLLAIVVVFGYIAATLMLALVVSQGGHASKIMMEAVTAAAVIVISVAAYLGKRTTRTGDHDTVDDDRLFRDCPIEHNRWNMDIWSADADCCNGLSGQENCDDDKWYCTGCHYSSFSQMLSGWRIRSAE